MLTAAIGITVKSGWAAAVLLTGSLSSPRVADSRRVDLSDPSIPESRQPYHAGFGTARQIGPELSGLVESVRTYGTGALTRLFREYRAGHRLAGVGVVVGSLTDPDTIANEHIRIHAREGQLFRSVVEHAAAATALRCEICRERDLYERAASLLKLREERIQKAVTTLGRSAARPWRAEQKAATVAAWLVLAGEREH